MRPGDNRGGAAPAWSEAVAIGINPEYPERWSIRVLRIYADGDHVLSEVEVPQETKGVFRVLALSTVRDELLVHSREYWVELGVEQAPPWRAPYRTRASGDG